MVSSVSSASMSSTSCFESAMAAEATASGEIRERSAAEIRIAEDLPRIAEQIQDGNQQVVVRQAAVAQPAPGAQPTPVARQQKGHVALVVAGRVLQLRPEEDHALVQQRVA